MSLLLFWLFIFSALVQTKAHENELLFSRNFAEKKVKETRKNSNKIKLEKELIIGVPAKGPFPEFVDVKYDQVHNKTSISGFSIEVFEAAVKLLPYHLPYVFIPFHGTYDEMVIAVYNKTLDAAVGDTNLLGTRYTYTDFSQPYMDSQIAMVVPLKEDLKKRKFIVVEAFEWELWMVMATLSFSTGAIIYFNEHVNDNPDFAGLFPQKIGSMLWFSVTLLSFTQRESIKNNLSRLVLATWFFVVVVVAASYTAVLSSMMTVPRLQPSIVDIDYLQKTNATVGCNGKGFVVKYLVNTLKFKEANIKKMDSHSEYPEAFEKGLIAAAFLISPHAKVFVAQHSKRYVMAKPIFEVGGLAYVFPKGSSLAHDITQAILNMKENGAMKQMQERLLSLSTLSSSTERDDDLSLGLGHFYGPLIVSSTISASVLLIIILRVIVRRWPIHELVQSFLIHKRVSRWASIILTQQKARFGPRFFSVPIIQRQNNLTDIV